MGTTHNDSTGFTAARDEWAAEQTIAAQAEHEADGWGDDSEHDDEQEIAQARALAPIMVYNAATQPTRLSEPRWSPEDELALKNTVAKDCTPAQFRVFMGAARRLGLDPFARQIVPIVQGGKMTPQTTIDGFRLIAERTGKYAGQLGPLWCGKDGEWREVWLDDGLPIAAKVGVLRRDFAQPLYDVAHMRSYKKDSPTWKQLPIEMLAKVAEARALRRAFPQELAGVYTDDELSVVDADPSSQPSAVGAAVTVIEGHATPAPAPRTTPPAATSTPSGALSITDFCKAVKAELGITPKQAMEKLGVKSLDGINLNTALLKLHGMLGVEQQTPEERAIAAAIIEPDNDRAPASDWIALSDPRFVARCKVLGWRSVANVEELLAAADATRADGETLRAAAYRYLDGQEEMAKLAAAAVGKRGN